MVVTTNEARVSRPRTQRQNRPQPTGGRELRADAARNRGRILKAAREVFAEQGLNVPIEQIAARAGVGVATLYRRFPTREDLIAASFEEKMQGYLDAIESGLADPDPWSGFCGYFRRICAMQASDQGLRDVLTMTFPMAPQFEADRKRAFESLSELLGRAKAAGALRDDFTIEDIPLLLMANAGVLQATAGIAPGAWKRFTELMLESFRAERARPLPKPPSASQMKKAMAAALNRPR